jgi:predicted nucleotidyltransferase
VNKHQVLDELKAHLGDFPAFGVQRIALFGSIVHDASTPESDIDILVRFLPAKKTFDNFMGLRACLEDMFPGRKIDLVLEDALKPAIRDKVLSEAADVA